MGTPEGSPADQDKKSNRTEREYPRPPRIGTSEDKRAGGED